VTISTLIQIEPRKGICNQKSSLHLKIQPSQAARKVRSKFGNASNSIRVNLDTFSITIDLMDLFLSRLSDETNLINEESHSLLTMK
jgi:hypothetical protein